jgi:hypothetical protein
MEEGFLSSPTQHRIRIPLTRFGSPRFFQRRSLPLRPPAGPPVIVRIRQIGLHADRNAAMPANTRTRRKQGPAGHLASKIISASTDGDYRNLSPIMTASPISRSRGRIGSIPPAKLEWSVSLGQPRKFSLGAGKWRIGFNRALSESSMANQTAHARQRNGWREGGLAG